MRTCNRVVWSVFFALLANVASGAGGVSSLGAFEVPHDVCALQTSAGQAGSGDLSALQGLMGIASGEEPASAVIGAGPVHQATLDTDRVRAPRTVPLLLAMPDVAQWFVGDTGAARSVSQEPSPAPPRALLSLGPHAPPSLA